MKSSQPIESGSMLLALQRATHVTLHVLTTRLSGLGLTPGEINAVANIPATGSRTVSELGTAMGTKPSTATSILDRLEQRGLVSRGPRPGGRRAVQVALTPAGRAVARHVSAALRDLEREALGGLSASQTAALAAGLQALAEVQP